MATYHYQAVDAAGGLVAGELEAASVQQALAELESRGLVLQSIGLVATHASTPSHETPPRPVGESLEKEVLRTHLATVLERGRNILPALEAYTEELPRGRQRKQMQSVCRVLASGDAAQATAALVDSPEYWIPLLSAATLSIEPGQVLDTFLSESRRTDEIRHQWWLTLAYPIGLACLALVVLMALSVFVIPEFGKIFSEFDLELPGLTRFVLDVASWLSSGWALAALALLVATIELLWLVNRRVPASRFGWWSDRLRLPFGRRSAIARFSRFLADLLDAGLGLPDALRIAGFTVDHSRLQGSAWRMANELDTAGKSSARIERIPLTTSVFHAISADVPESTRVRLLRDVSACHAERVRIGMSWASGIVEPLGIFFVGFVVGMVVLALFLPLVKLIEGLSG